MPVWYKPPFSFSLPALEGHTNYVTALFTPKSLSAPRTQMCPKPWKNVVTVRYILLLARFRQQAQF